MHVHNVSRRVFLQNAGVSLGGMALAGAGRSLAAEQAPQTALRIRPDITSLSPNSPQIKSLRAGVAAMRALDDGNPKSWVAQANIHNNFCPHNNWYLLPWHRAYLFYFEQICREASGDSTFALPYWNWSTTPRLPAVYWGDDNPLNDDTREIGPNDSADPSFVASSVIDSILQISDFSTFGSGMALSQRPQTAPFGTTGQLEGTPHNYIHGWINGDMGNYVSPAYAT